MLFDTLIQSMEEDQVAAVLAHEIGHEKKNHVKKRLLLSLVLSLIGFWILSLLLNYEPFFHAFGFTGSSYHAAVVLLSFCAGPFTFFLKPLAAMWSRKHEYEADRFAVATGGSGGADSMTGALINLNRKNLSNLNPHRLYSFYHYSHPALAERIDAIEQYAAKTKPK